MAILALALVAIGFLMLGGGRTRSAPRSLVVAATYGRLPLSFEPNRGQSGAAVRFLATGPGPGLFLTREGADLSFGAGKPAGAASPVLPMRLIGATADRRIGGVGRLPGKANYISPGSSGQEVGIPTYRGVRYSRVWPGIAIRFYGNQRRFEYDLNLAPGARASEIALGFGSRRALSLTPGGTLLVRLGAASVRQPRPRAYQVIGGARQPVAAHYVLGGGGRVRISIGAYDHRQRLTIDPRLIYSTYLARGIKSPAYAIAVDDAGNAYVTGSTNSPLFPVSRHALQTKLPHGREAEVSFVTKLAPNGHLIYSTYLGAGGGSFADAIAVDRRGAAYIGGSTYPRGMPTTKNALQPQARGISESGFVAKLAPSGRRLIYSTYLGGSSEAGGEVNAIAVDPAGEAYVAGDCGSEDFPITPAAAEPLAGVPPHSFLEPMGFVAKLNRSGSRLIYSTFLGGSGWNTPGGIALDRAGDAYVAGSTGSHDFPITPDAFQSVNRADAEFNNAFVTKLDPSGARFLYSTYLGGTLSDEAKAVAVDPAGDVVVTGDAGSGNFPTTAGALQRHLQGYDSAFVSTLSPDGGRLLHSTLLGRETSGRGIALNHHGDAFLVGFRSAKPIMGVDRGYRGFLAELDPSAHRLLSWTKLGGSRARAAAVALDRAGDAYAAGGSGPGLKAEAPIPPGRATVPPEYPSAFVTKLRP